MKFVSHLVLRMKIREIHIQIHPVDVQDLRLWGQPLRGMPSRLQLLLCPVHETVHRAQGALGEICRRESQRSRFAAQGNHAQKGRRGLDEWGLRPPDLTHARLDREPKSKLLEGFYFPEKISSKKNVIACQERRSESGL